MKSKRARHLRTGWRRLHGMKGEVYLTVRIVYGDGAPYIVNAIANAPDHRTWAAELPSNQHLGRPV